MIATRTKPRQRRLNKNKCRQAAPRSVQNLLLDLAYNLHATRVVRILPAETRTAIQ